MTGSGGVPQLRWIDAYRVSVGRVEFLTSGPEGVDDASMGKLLMLGSRESTPERFVMLKSRLLVERYAEWLAALRPDRVLELGIFKGGSVAFLAELARPGRLVAIDHQQASVAALDEYIAARDDDAVVTHYGVDQADVERLATIVASEFRDAPLDLVVDDASHELAATRASFDALFPRLRPGGAYVIEDWSWGAFTLDAPTYQQHFEPTGPPLASLVLELVLACANAPALIDGIELHWNVAVIRRGAASLRPGTFALADCYDPRWRETLKHAARST